MILVDTSVWIDHLRNGNSTLSQILDDNGVLTHSFVIGELVCGNLKNRSRILTVWVPAFRDVRQLLHG
jgi:predicted nucleic acid-binding protein